MLGVIAGVLIGDHHGTSYWWLTLLLSAIICISFRKSALSLFMAGIITAHGLHGLTITRQQAWADSLDPDHHTLHIHLEGVIIDTGGNDTGPYLMKVLAYPDTQDLKTGVRVQLSIPRTETQDISSTPPLKYGDLISVEGNLTPIPELRNPHGFDRAAWLHRQGANLTIKPTKPLTLQGVDPMRRPVRLTSEWRVYLRKQMTLGLEDGSQEAQLIRAVVLGERPPQPSVMLEDFRQSGTLHVFAVSGLHVGMVGTIIGLVLWFLRVPRWMLIILTILGMASYAGITGLRPPSVRAVLMATVFLSGFLIQRRPTLINSLAASAVLVLLWDGHQLFTPGFQLSYGVLLSLALLAGMWARALKPMGEIDPFVPHLLLTSWQEMRLNVRKWLKNSLSISLAAWMGSAPLMWIHFGIITPIAIIAGIPLMLMVFLLLAMTMLSIAIGAIWQPAGSAINQANALIAQGTYHTASFFARSPGSHYYATPTSAAGNSIIVFDIPYGGGASFINLGGGILLDSGKQNHFFRHVLPTLNTLKTSPDSLIITHAESSHSGGMSQCLINFYPKQALIPRTDLRSPSYKEFLKRAKLMSCKLIVPQRGQLFQIEPHVFLEILHAPAELDGYGLADDTGLVIRLHWHGWRILFTGDAGFSTETRMLKSGMDLSADVIVMGRNSDDYSGTETFISAVSPEAIITTNSGFPDSERVTAAWRKEVINSGITLFDQQLTGAVTITLENRNLVLTPMLSGAQPLTLIP